MYTIRKREATLEDILKLKNYNPFKTMRFRGKTLNLSSLFAAQGPTIGKQLKAAGINEEDCDQILDSLNLTHAFNSALNGPKNKLSPLDLKYVIIGNKLRELFFQTYPSLLKRVEREQKFAIKNGYVRTWVGPIRHLPELRYLKTNANNNLIGIDQKLYSKMFANLKNIASNTTIQTAEVYQAAPNVTAIQTLMKEWGFKSRIYNYVHDSIVFYIYKPEKELVYALLNQVAQEHREPYYGLRMYIDVNEADPDRGEVYDSGKEISLDNYHLEDEIPKWNETHGVNIQYRSLIPK